MESTNQRYNSLDALRAIMMVLGLVIHTILGYTTYTEGFFSRFYKDPFTSPVCDMLLWWIHIFRMPVFFVMAGFFALLVYERKGKNAFIKNRLSRILYPLIVGWIVLMPFIRFADNFAHAALQTGVQAGLKPAMHETLDNPFGISPMHLWFLWFLCLFYVLLLLVLKLPFSLRLSSINLFKKLIGIRFSSMIFSMVTILFLCLMQTGTFDTPKRFFPINAAVFFSYFYFFMFGALLYKCRDLLGVFKKDIWPQVVLSLVAFGVHFYFVDLMQYEINLTTARVLMASVSGGICCWLSVFSLMGIFLKYLENKNKYLRYVSDTSYWVFLVHVPLVVFLQGVFSGFALPALIKCALILVITYSTLLITYHFFVRKTFIGKFLNGKKQ